ncbi:putative transmembrane channel-like protein 8 [Scophthalmus maximus]|uniref:Transmembrane channel-like protein n=1 Tax=Scophthalmus maximus TaxID=52904 RepID=A0A2U9BPM8_SCOMX|nr:transmembrane channel-like protein 7 [Scophthalmus maximus]XP_035494328.1 transmembrane channel-like protein 7 [Scophthalmus maximus]XP_035494329.1 transmembrane channel-like protein 7 [Scophthalmus maximus]XP_047190072.1 transmembrane channel-like protein 7 [Scophthalmus maximus]XP_047190073.1 transmembrane channel-like protein 7 [Scophthalmus maximus]AWP06115.1 putative transmembrane channel-like protein 8 [Scophthalmus maximus]
MEEHHSVNVTSVLSDASPHSTLSLESCEYYQTEIFDQLPSIQACRPGRSRQGVLGVCEAERGSPQPGEKRSDGHPWTRAPRDKASLQPLRNLAMCIEAKRGARVRRQMEISNIGYWESWRRSQSINRKRVWAQMRGSLSGMLPWKRTLRVIEGRFGVGVKAYFVFLRYLIYLNLLHCALVWGYILGPTTFYGRGNSSKPWRFGSKDSFLQFFNGSSYLNQSPVFYGFYTRGSLNFPCLHTPLLYFAGILTILFLSLAMVVRRMTVGLKHTWLLGKRYSVNVSYKIFRGWDFTIQDPAAGTLKQSFIRNDLKLFLEEQSFSQREAKRTLGQRVRLYLLRFILNVLVVSLLGGAFYLIFFATETSLEECGHGWFVSLFLQYLAPITITFVNLVLPNIFRKISSFEDYSLTTQVNTTIVRSIFLKLASLGIYLYFLFKTTKALEQHQCKENRFGREICKLSIFNFLAMFFKTFLLEFPRKLVQEKYPTSLLARRLGTQSFLITFNVLDLVYSQTVSWVGIYYCPLLPLIGIVTLVATFYIKKFTVLRCCVAEQRMFRATSSSVLFHFMLLLGLLMAAAALGFSLLQEEVTVDKMSSCGPFGNGETLYNVTGVCVDSLPSLAQSVLRYMASEAFAVPLILTEIIILTSYVSRGRVNQRAILRLEDMLVTSSSDKRFLVRQHTTMLRLQRELRRLRSASFREDAAPSVAGKTSRPPPPPPENEAD